MPLLWRKFSMWLSMNYSHERDLSFIPSFQATAAVYHAPDFHEVYNENPFEEAGREMNRFVLSQRLIGTCGTTGKLFWNFLTLISLHYRQSHSICFPLSRDNFVIARGKDFPRRYVESKRQTERGREKTRELGLNPLMEKIWREKGEGERERECENFVSRETLHSRRC